MESNMKNSILLILVGCVIGIVGVYAYYHHMNGLFITCAIIGVIQFVLGVITHTLNGHVYPYMLSCVIMGHYTANTFPECVYYGICLYYASAWLYMLLIAALSETVVFIILSFASIVSYFFNMDCLFIVLGICCTTNILVAWFSGRLKLGSVRLLTESVVIGICVLASRMAEIFFLKGILLGCSFFYIASLVKAYRIHAKYKGRKLTKEEIIDEINNG